MFTRVIPRDLFNEAKLLKSIGQLTLQIHDGKCSLTFEFDNTTHQGFNIEQSDSDGRLEITNLSFYMPDGDTPIYFATQYNSKDAYPLWFTTQDEQEGRVFNEDGSFSDDFNYLFS